METSKQNYTPKLGDKVSDTITGFTGVVTAHIQYIHDEDQFQLTGDGNEPNKPPVTEWFSPLRLTFIKSFQTNVLLK